MKAAANVVAVLAWGSFLAAMWYPYVADVHPSLGFWLCTALTFLVGLIVPSYLLNLEVKTRPSANKTITGSQAKTRPAARDE